MLKSVALENWENYQSSDLKPADFDEFWKKGKKEVEDLGVNYQLVQHEIYSSIAEGFDLYFEGVNGARIHAQLVRPKNIQKKMPVLFQFQVTIVMLAIGAIKSPMLPKAS